MLPVQCRLALQKVMIEAPLSQSRLRRLRQSPWVRDLVAETTLSVSDLIWPLYVRTSSTPAEIPAMPGVVRYTLEELPAVLSQACAWGIPAIALFPVIDPSLKTPDGREATNPNNLICQAIQCAKAVAPQLGIIADVALDPFTDHGHDGVIQGDHVDNDATVEVLCTQALIQAQAGADMVAPSDMMDGRVHAIRTALSQAGFTHTLILSYSAKYASAFYRPYRQAIQSGGLTQGPKDKLTYQLNPANAREAIRCAHRDVQEGADMIMVKPALPYLDIIHELASTLHLPVLAFQVSGEYAALKAAHENGWLQASDVLYESLLSIKRAGACAILAYGVPDIVAAL